MSEQLYIAVKKILDMPYYQNEQARSGGANYGHEHAVEIHIKSAGFVPVYKKDGKFKKITKTLLKEWITTGNDVKLREAATELLEGQYIAQPSGSQGSPDFLIHDHGDRFVGIECKSGKDGVCPMWNDSLPGYNVIYVLSSGSVNQTTIFLGPDVIEDAVKETIKRQEEERSQIDKKYNKICLSISKRGFIQKTRKQHFQQGGGAVTNYFIHPDRKQCETNALEFAKQ
jgi:hypothetical protein